MARAYDDDDERRGRPGRSLRIDLTVRSALVAVGTVAAVWFVLRVWQVLVVILVALMLVGMMNPLVEWLEKKHWKRGLAIAAVFGGITLLVGGFVALTVPKGVAQLADLFDHFPRTQQRVATQLEQWKLTTGLAKSVRALRAEAVAEKAKEYGLTYGPAALEIGAYALSAMFLALYLIIDRDRMRGVLFALVPRRFHVRTSRVLINLETIVGGYMRGQAITSALMAVFTFIVLMAFGVPNALVLALFAGVADVLPYVGALLACGPAVLAAMSKGTSVALIVMGILAVYQEFESRFIIPRVYGKVLRLPAAAVMVALLLGGKLFGILGALLALPIAAAIRMMLAELRVELPGEDLVDDGLRAKDAQAEAEFAARAAGLPAREAASIATEIAAAREDEHDDACGPAPITSGTPSTH